MKMLLVPLALAVALLLAPTSPALAHGNDGGGNYYQVQNGDLSLWTISFKLDIPFGVLLDLNWDEPGLSECLMIGDWVRISY